MLDEEKKHAIAACLNSPAIGLTVSEKKDLLDFVARRALLLERFAAKDFGSKFKNTPDYLRHLDFLASAVEYPEGVTSTQKRKAFVQALLPHLAHKRPDKRMASYSVEFMIVDESLQTRLVVTKKTIMGQRGILNAAIDIVNRYPFHEIGPQPEIRGAWVSNWGGTLPSLSNKLSKCPGCVHILPFQVFVGAGDQRREERWRVECVIEKWG